MIGSLPSLETTAVRRSLLPHRGARAWFGRPVFLEARSPFELKALRRHPLWRGVGIPHGHGRPILVIPGFLASPTSADSLVHILEQAGWDARIAEVGRNSGPAYAGVESSERDLHRLFADVGRPVVVIGHSRGGQFARILAVRYPEMVRQIITLGTPLLMKYPRFAPLRVPIELLEMSWRRGAFGPVNHDREEAVDRDRFVDFPSFIDFVSIYSRTDGFVDWRASLDPAASLVEISVSHLGLINSVAGVQAITDALHRLQPRTDYPGRR
jgi:pimeloyl-ACP methyl ester carboxylesterase